jgi:hypothetical protein
MHASKPIMADLGKLDKSIAQEIRRVANADTRGSDARGAERPLPAVGMKPVSASRTGTLPHQLPMPRR